MRKQANSYLDKRKDFFQHGGQDDWAPAQYPDPPVTVFFPDGRPPRHLKTAQEMRDFYENELGIRWTYKEK
jgi:hypothetical protein